MSTMSPTTEQSNATLYIYPSDRSGADSHHFNTLAPGLSYVCDAGTEPGGKKAALSWDDLRDVRDSLKKFLSDRAGPNTSSGPPPYLVNDIRKLVTEWCELDTGSGHGNVDIKSISSAKDEPVRGLLKNHLKSVHSTFTAGDVSLVPLLQLTSREICWRASLDI